MYGFENKYPYTDFHELNLDWVLENVKRIADEHDIIIKDIQKLKDDTENLTEFYSALMTGDFPDDFKASLAAWFQSNSVELFGGLVKFVFFGITDQGYFVAYIPESWEDIQFGTTGYDDIVPDMDYGHLTLSY